MTDIIVRCSGCGHELTVSEYASSDDLSCPSCNSRLDVPAMTSVPSLQLRKTSFRHNQSLLGVEAAAYASQPLAAAHLGAGDLGGSSVMEDVYKIRGKVKSQRTVVGWLLFLVVFAVMVLLQDTVRSNTDVLGTYLWVRGILGGLLYLMVLIVAFEDSLWQGLLSLFVLPYSVYYALSRLDSHVLKCLFLAFLFSLGAELHFLPKHAIINKVEPAVNNVIRSGERAIQRAGDAPSFD